MNSQLSLQNIRSVLIRLEQNIIYTLTERSLFKINSKIYEQQAFPLLPDNHSLMTSLLYETECAEAKLRRFTSPDEESFFPNQLPQPILPRLNFQSSPLLPNKLNINDKILTIYQKNIIPLISYKGDDQQYGSSCVADVACLQNLSKRIHYGKFVAESKYRQNQEKLQNIIDIGDKEALLAAITDDKVEEIVLERIKKKTTTWCNEVAVALLECKHLVEIYKNWIIPLTKDVQVKYLMQYAVCNDI